MGATLHHPLHLPQWRTVGHAVLVSGALVGATSLLLMLGGYGVSWAWTAGKGTGATETVAAQLATLTASVQNGFRDVNGRIDKLVISTHGDQISVHDRLSKIEGTLHMSVPPAPQRSADEATRAVSAEALAPLEKDR
jgi:hypothetical protein